jgi:hypothetical protein
MSARIDRTGGQARIILLGSDGNAARDMVLLKQTFAAGNRLCALVPLGGGGDGLAVEWELRAAPSAEPDAARYRILAEVASRRLAALRANSDRPPDDRARGIGSLAGQVDSTSSLTQARSAMRALAQSVGASLAEDVACVADQQAIEQISAEVRAEAASTAEPKALAFLLERSSILLLAGRLEREELSPIADGILLAHTGAVGRFPDRLREAVARADDLPSLDEVLIEENRRLLRDTGPAHRVRAFDWLRRRQLAPEGFDPLASAAERRTALAQAERTMAQEGRR